MGFNDPRLALFGAVALILVGYSSAEEPDNLLPYLEKCCQLGQEFARSRYSCDERKIVLSHKRRIPAGATSGVANVTCTFAATQCCEHTLDREVNCNAGIEGARSASICSSHPNHVARACCSWCKAGLERQIGDCVELPAEIPEMIKMAFNACCQRKPALELTKQCSPTSCSNDHTCTPPWESCNYDDKNCHYRCVDTASNCPGGYKLDSNENCLDIDECAEKSHSCGPNELCKNVPGSYECSGCNCRE